jgi:hypothetical protein
LPFIHIVVKTFESRYIYDTLTAQEVLNVNWFLKAEKYVVYPEYLFILMQPVHDRQ